MSIFTSDAFLQTISESYFGGKARIEEVRLAGRRYRTLVQGRRVIAQVPFLDFLVPLDDAPTSGSDDLRKLGYAPHVALGSVTASDWRDGNLAALGALSPASVQPSPWIDWRAFADFEAFITHVRQQTRSGFKDTGRKKRKLEREVGPLNLQLADPSRDALEICIGWKEAQYQRSGFWNLFAVPENKAFMWRLWERGVLTVSSLRAGDKLLAVHVGAVHQGRFYSWLPAFDHAFKGCSPGTILAEFFLRESFDAGHSAFDFLIGDEPYKWWYATHAEVVGPVGQPPWYQARWQGMRAPLMRAVRRQQAVYNGLRGFKRWLLEKRLLGRA